MDIALITIAKSRLEKFEIFYNYLEQDKMEIIPHVKVFGGAPWPRNPFCWAFSSYFSSWLYLFLPFQIEFYWQ